MASPLRTACLLRTCMAPASSTNVLKHEVGSRYNRTLTRAISLRHCGRQSIDNLSARQLFRRPYSNEAGKSKANDAIRRLAGGPDKDRFVPTDAEVEDFKKRAEAEQRMYNALMPDLNWGLTHPVTWVLFALCVGLHFYTGYRQKQVDAQKEEQRKEEARLLSKEYVEVNSPKKGWE